MKNRLLIVALATAMALLLGFAMTPRVQASGTSAYRHGVLQVLNLFIDGNGKVGAVGVDLQRNNFGKAAVDIANAARKIDSAKKHLDRLKVPSSATAREIQTLYERAFRKFVAGVGAMSLAVKGKSVPRFDHGLNTYKGGLTAFNQATPLWSQLK